MSAAEHLLVEVLSLSADERARLAHRLLESLDPASDDGVEKAWLAELRQRATELSSGTVTAVPWETARQQILSELGKRRASRNTP
jgi:putative addiction module component (TIGR02574 family)